MDSGFLCAMITVDIFIMNSMKPGFCFFLPKLIEFCSINTALVCMKTVWLGLFTL